MSTDREEIAIQMAIDNNWGCVIVSDDNMWLYHQTNKYAEAGWRLVPDHILRSYGVNPGPWFVAQPGDDDEIHVVGTIYSKTRSIGEVYTDDYQDDEEAKANAGLMAAAPDLLEMVESIATMNMRYSDDGEYAAEEARRVLFELRERGLLSPSNRVFQDVRFKDFESRRKG